MRRTLLSLLALAFAPVAQAQMANGRGGVPNNDDPAAAAAQEFRALQLRGRDVRLGIAKLRRELTWHKTLSSAAKAALDAGKPIVWIQALGDLQGYT